MSAPDKKNPLFFGLLFIALASIFLLQNHTNGFNTEHHGFTSSRGADIAKGLIVEDNHLVMLYNKQMLRDGTVYYHPYNRYPVFPFLLIGATMQVFEPDLSMQIYSARQLMNLFVAAALILCIIIMNELIGNRLLSLSASLAVFSSYYLLYYNDMIFCDTTAIFGYVLALFLVVKSWKQNMRKRYLIVLPMVSIATGWQPYSVFMAWFIVDALTHLRSIKLSLTNVTGVFRRPAFIALAAAVIFGVFVLGGELLLEWDIRGGKFIDLPSVHSMVARIGVTSNALQWDVFALKQAYRMFNMIIPFSGVFTGHMQLMEHLTLGRISFVLGALFVLASGTLCIYSLKKYSKQMDFALFAVFILSGFVWSIPMRQYTAYHDYQSPFYIGFSIVFFIILFTYIGVSHAKAAAVIACALFTLSVYQMNEYKSVDARRLNAITEEFSNMYAKLPRSSKVYVDCAKRVGTDRFGMDYCRNEISGDLEIGGQSLDFFLAGHYRAFEDMADYVISKDPSYNRDKLTNNPRFNLFKSTVH